MGGSISTSLAPADRLWCSVSFSAMFYTSYQNMQSYFSFLKIKYLLFVRNFLKGVFTGYSQLPLSRGLITETKEERKLSKYKHMFTEMKQPKPRVHYKNSIWHQQVNKQTNITTTSTLSWLHTRSLGPGEAIKIPCSSTCWRRNSQSLARPIE